jgi:hypothetical protein
MEPLMRIVLALLVLTTSASTCVQIGSGPTALHGKAVLGTFTYDHRPLKDSKVELRNPDGKLLETTATDASGHYRFEMKKDGEYRVIMLNPSYEPFDIDFHFAGNVAEIFSVNFYNDYCRKVTVQQN